MLYWLLYEKLFPFFHPFRIFRYLTFRTAFASLTALLIALFIGPYVIQKLREFQIGQYIREDGPQSHLKKSGTPTMGGVLIVIAILLPTVLWADPANPFVWIAVCLHARLRRHRFCRRLHQGRPAAAISASPRAPSSSGRVWSPPSLPPPSLHSPSSVCSPPNSPCPSSSPLRPDLHWHWLASIPHLGFLAFLPFVAFVVFVLMGSTNAVNLTDGLDGLAIGCTIIAAGALTVLTYVSGHVVFADYLELQRMPMVGELTVFCGSMVGASIGFLWYNAHPAEIFMGDVGSLALGGAIGTVAVIIRQELLLPFIGGIFVLEALSVVLQVGSYKLRKKRIFKMAPLHHHFEQLGWSESKVIVRFWILALVFALFALTTLKLR